MKAKFFSLKFFFLLFFGATTFYGQNPELSGVVAYSYNRDLGIPAQDNWNLIFEGDKSIFMLASNTELGQEKAQESSDLKSFEIEVDDRLTPHLVNDLGKDSIYSQGLVFRDPYYVVAKIHSPQWNLQEEKKEIAGFLCQKATTSFRGRNYEVWFTPEIPVNFGPWKLNGLPGLILTARDETGQIEFRATRVSLNQRVDVDAQIERLPKLGPRIPLKEYVAKKDNEGKDISRHVVSRMSRERNSSSKFEASGRGNNIEITYEWEEEQ